MIELCAPALIYLAFSLTQIIIDTFKGLYNTAFFKVIVMIIITLLLNALCKSGMGVISWIIVFVPFIFMSVIVAILLYVFGLDPATGKLNIVNSESKNYQKGGNLIYISSPINTYDQIHTNTSASDPIKIIPSGSSDPQFE